VLGLPGVRIDGASTFEILPAEARWVTVAVRIPPQTASQSGPGAHAIEFETRLLDTAPGANVATSIEKSTFVVPR
jgi:hypothetical protein